MPAQSLVKDVIDEALKLANRVSVADRGRALEAVNRAVRKYAQRAPWPGLKRTEVFVTDGTRFMIFPERVAKVIELADVSDATEIRHDDRFLQNHGPVYLAGTAGRPCAWREAGTVPVVRQPATDSPLYFVAAASDVITADVFGLVRDTAASGSMLEFYEVREQVSIVGSGVTSVSTNLYVELKAIHKDQDSVARVDVGDYTGKVVARLLPQRGQAAYRRLEFELVPGEGRSIKVEYYTWPDRVNSETQPIDPTINLEYLVWRTAAEIHWISKEAQAYQAAAQTADEILAAEANKERTFSAADEISAPPWTYRDAEDY